MENAKSQSKGKARRPRPTEIVAIVFFGVVIICLLPILIPLALGYFCYRRIRDQIFFFQNAGKLIFVVDGKHGWRELIANNAIPSLPEGIEPIWFQSRVLGEMQSRVLQGQWAQRPFIGLVTNWGIKKVSLHERLLPLKTHGKRDPQVQTEVRKIINEAVREIERRGCTV